MSEAAKQWLWEELDESDGALDFNETVDELVLEFDVQRSTAVNYVYQYCDWEDPDGEDKVIIDRAEKYRHRTTNSKSDHREADAESLDEPIPGPAGETYNGLTVVDPGHPLVPNCRAYLERRIDSDYLPFDLDDNIKDVEVLPKAMSFDDFGVILVGEPGTGKGHLIKKVFSETNRPLVRVNFGSRITKEKLVGGYVPSGNGKDLEAMLEKAKDLTEENEELALGDALEALNVRHKFKWKDGLLTKAVRHGWGFQADEINAAPAETLMPLFGLLEDADSRTLELTEKGEVIRPHPEFQFVGTMNPPHHPGTKELSDALLRRVTTIPIPYLPKDREAKLLKKRTGVTNGDASDLVDLASAIRNSYPNDIGVTCTPSELEQIAKLGEEMSLKGAAKMVLLSMASTQNDRDALERRIDLAFDD